MGYQITSIYLVLRHLINIFSNFCFTILYIDCSLFRSLIRSVCKAVVSLFCPLLVLLVFARNGQTVYDRLTKSVVVHVSHLYRPVYSNELPNT